MKAAQRLCASLGVIMVIALVSNAAPPPGKGVGNGGNNGDGDSEPVLDHKALQEAPIKQGTSGGWRYDLANGYCYGGTLGSLVTNGAKQYILSNFHVLAADTASRGNSRVTQIGDPVIQPGLIDVRCNANSAQNVAALSGYGDPLLGANIDAVIAEVIPGMVSRTGEILGIGALSSETALASLRQKVKKSGRTTGLTSSRVDGLNATVRVSYEDECAGGVRGTATHSLGGLPVVVREVGRVVAF